MNLKTLLLGALTLFVVSSSTQAQSARWLLDQMYAATNNTARMSYEMSSQERFNGKYIYKKMSFTLNVNPRKVYMKDHDTGVELLYVSGWNDNKAYINPNGFPWVNVSLNILDNKVRKDNHHPVSHAGFGYVSVMLKAVEKQIQNEGEKLEDHITVQGEIEWNGTKCYRMLLENKQYAYISYTCTQKESLLSLCERLNIPEYAVIEKNNLSFGSWVSPGKVLQIPNSFAKKVIFYVDKSTFMPVVQMIYDDKDLYEKYEFRNVKLNQSADKHEWTTQCASYGF